MMPTAVQDTITHPAIRAQITALESFGSALLLQTAQPHTVQLFIKRRLQMLRRTEEEDAEASVEDEDVVLLWRLLQLCVQQRGRVYGPDMAALLMDDLPTHDHYAECVEAVDRQTEADHAIALRQLCAGGHLREALAHAQKHNMWPEALFFAYKLGDYRVFDRFVASFAQGDPVRTVAQLLSGSSAEVSCFPNIR